MTSFAFILGVVPLVLATGAGANARKSIGIVDALLRFNDARAGVLEPGDRVIYLRSHRR